MLELHAEKCDKKPYTYSNGRSIKSILGIAQKVEYKTFSSLMFIVPGLISGQHAAHAHSVNVLCSHY